MFRICLAKRVCWLLALCGCALLLGALPARATAQVPAGPTFPNADWAAWGIGATFDSGTPVIKFAAYVGVIDSQPSLPGNQPQVLGKLVEDISAQCITRSTTGAANPTLSIDAAGYANFDGTLYLECSTPDWGAMIRSIAPHLKPANLSECNCPVDRSPVWASADLILNPVATGVRRLNPLIDASRLGFSFSLPTDGPAARTRLTRSNGSADLGPWTYDSTGGNRLLAGQNGPVDVAIINFFGGLPYLTGTGWVPYFNTQVLGGKVGQWLEPANQGSRKNASLSEFTLGTGPGTVYIGRQNGTGEMLSAKVRALHGDPGCFGN